jgi:hypothetical protein
MAAEATAKAAAAPPPAPSLPGKSLLRLWLDERERPALDLDGATVDTTVIAEHTRKRLITLVTVMRPWLEGKPIVNAAPPPVVAPVAPAPVSAPAPIPPPTPTPATPLAPISYTPTPPPPPVQAPSFSSALVNSVANVISPTVKKEEKTSAPLTMVGQIDAILQERLAAGPLAGRGIKLVESPQGGVIVIVGTEKFNGVGDVTDPQIQAELRAAIAAWEKKYTPGL